MRIAFIAHYKELYGANRSLMNLILPLRNKGIEPVVILPQYGDLAALLQEEKIEFFIEPFGFSMGTPEKSKGVLRQTGKWIGFKRHGLKMTQVNMRAVETIYNKLKGRNIKLVYTNTSVTNVGYDLAKKMNIPHIWHIREFADKHYDLIPFSGKRIFLNKIRKSGHVIFISKVLKSYFQFNDAENTSIIYNGVLSKQKSLLLDTGYPQGNETVFALVGLISENKGQRNAITAFARLHLKYPSIRLLIAGGNSSIGETERVKNLIAQHELNNKVELLGYVKDPFSIYKQAHAVLMCSRNEAMGRVTAEAFHCARPVIGYNSGATPELIDHMVNGILYDSEIEGLYQAMEWVILNKEKCIEMGKNAKQKALDLFTTEKYADEVYAVIKKILS